MATVFDGLVVLGRKLGRFRDGVATAGNGTSLTDLADFPEPADHWNGGTVLVHTTNGSTSCGQSRVISDFGSGAFTYGSISSVPTIGATFTVLPKRVPRTVLLEALNQALRSVGPVAKEDESLSVVASQVEYALPADCSGEQIKQVWVEGDSGGNDYFRVAAWHVEAGGKVRLPLVDDYPAGRKIRLVYYGLATALTADSDSLPSQVPLAYIYERALADVFLWLEQASNLPLTGTLSLDADVIGDETPVTYVVERALAELFLHLDQASQLMDDTDYTLDADVITEEVNLAYVMEAALAECYLHLSVNTNESRYRDRVNLHLGRAQEYVTKPGPDYKDRAALQIKLADALLKDVREPDYKGRAAVQMQLAEGILRAQPVRRVGGEVKWRAYNPG